MMTSLSHPNSTRRGAGFSLVELMVALALSLFLMAGVMQIFLGSKQTYNAVEQVSRMQENVRYVVEAVSRATRNASYNGCSTGDGKFTNTLNSAASVAFDFAVGVTGFEAAGSGPGSTVTLASENPAASGTWNGGTVPTDVQALAIPGSDMLVVRIPGGLNVPIVQQNTSTHLFAKLTGSITDGCPGPADKLSGICQGDILLVSRCRDSRVFQVTSLAKESGAPCAAEECLKLGHDNTVLTPGNAITTWGGPDAPDDARFGPDAEIVRLQTRMFYVGVGSDGTPSLYQRVNANTSEELVSGVENMQILYGEDTDGDGVANRYRTANNVTDFNEVVSLRLSLLLRTDEPISQELNTRTYLLNGVTAATATTVDPFNDKRGRYVFTSTIKLRNRGS